MKSLSEIQSLSDKYLVNLKIKISSLKLRNMGAVRSFCRFSAEKEKYLAQWQPTTVVKSYLSEKPCSSIYQLCNLGSIACPLMPYLPCCKTVDKNWTALKDSEDLSVLIQESTWNISCYIESIPAILLRPHWVPLQWTKPILSLNVMSVPAEIGLVWFRALVLTSITLTPLNFTTTSSGNAPMRPSQLYFRPLGPSECLVLSCPLAGLIILKCFLSFVL